MKRFFLPLTLIIFFLINILYSQIPNIENRDKKKIKSGYIKYLL